MWKKYRTFATVYFMAEPKWGNAFWKFKIRKEFENI